MAATPFVTKADLERRLGASVVQMLFDHNNDGSADAASITQICEDASSKVRGALGLVYDLDTFDATVATELRRIALDAAVAMTARDFPGAYTRDWESLMVGVDRDLAAVRKGMANLGTKEPPEPAANQGGSVLLGSDYGATWGDF